jgi:hypothetical protein
MEIKGKLHLKYDTKQVSDKFQRREFVVVTADNPMYPQYIKCELSQEKCGLIDGLKTGDEISVAYNLRGREWTDPKSGEVKYFSSIEAWKVNKVESGVPVAAGVQSNELGIDDPDDTLPF